MMVISGLLLLSQGISITNMNIIASLVPRTSIPNMKSIQLKKKEVLKYHSGCHVNGITIGVRSVAYLLYPKELP